MKKMLKNLFKRAWGIIIAGNTTWDEIALEEKSIKEIRKSYLYPWIFITLILTFLFHLIYASERAFESAITNTIITSLALFGGYFVSNIICFAYLKKFKPELAQKAKCDTLVAYSFTIIILVEIVIVIIPSLFFLRILSLFAAYAIWEGCRAIWYLKEDDRGELVLVFSIILIFIPIIISKIFQFMLPNI